MRYTIEAAVLRDGLLKIESLKIEGPRDDEVLVRIVASGICRTDLDFLGDSMILGHEGAGVAVMVGARVKGIQRGDHVKGATRSNPCFASAKSDARFLLLTRALHLGYRIHSRQIFGKRLLSRMPPKESSATQGRQER